MGVFGSDFEVSASPAAPALLKLAARKSVNDAARASHTARELAANVRERMERALGLGWHVVVGTEFSVQLRYRKGACVLLSSKNANMKVLLFRTTPAVTPVPKADHAALTSGDAALDAKRKTTVYECDMEDEMKDAVLDRSKRLYNSLEGEEEVETKLVLALKESLTFAYGHTWQVIVAAQRDFCCLPHVETGSYIDFAISKLRVVVYRHAGASLDRQLDMAQFGKRTAFVFATICLVVFTFLSFNTSEVHAHCLPKDNEAIPEDCSEEDVASAHNYALWKKGALIGMTGFTILASGVRAYFNSIRPKYKQA